MGISFSIQHSFPFPQVRLNLIIIRSKWMYNFPYALSNLSHALPCLSNNLYLGFWEISKLQKTPWNALLDSWTRKLQKNIYLTATFFASFHRNIFKNLIKIIPFLDYQAIFLITKPFFKQNRQPQIQHNSLSKGSLLALRFI